MMHQCYDGWAVWSARRDFPGHLGSQAAADVMFMCDAEVWEDFTRYKYMSEDEREEAQAIQRYNAYISRISRKGTGSSAPAPATNPQPAV